MLCLKEGVDHQWLTFDPLEIMGHELRALECGRRDAQTSPVYVCPAVSWGMATLFGFSVKPICCLVVDWFQLCTSIALDAIRPKSSLSIKPAVLHTKSHLEWKPFTAVFSVSFVSFRAHRLAHVYSTHIHQKACTQPLLLPSGWTVQYLCWRTALHLQLE